MNGSFPIIMYMFRTQSVLEITWSVEKYTHITELSGKPRNVIFVTNVSEMEVRLYVFVCLFVEFMTHCVK